MLLTKTPHKIGSIYQSSLELPVKNFPLIDHFVKLVENKIHENFSSGIEITTFEISSLEDIPDYRCLEESDPIFDDLEKIATHIRKNSTRIFFYLPQYFFLGSQLPHVVEDTKEVLERISLFLENIGVNSPSIIIRIGSAYGARKSTMERFNQEVMSLPMGIRKFLMVTNDDKPSLFSVTDLLSGVFYSISIPICFRTLPHFFNSGGLSLREALYLSCSTWSDGNKPIFIHSEPEAVDENGFPLSSSPKEKLSHRIPVFSLDVDVIIESKNSKNSCVRYMAEARSLKPMVINKVTK
jgi:UV DNA damage endonuclease